MPRAVGAAPLFHAAGSDPLSSLLDVGADMLPLPGPLQQVARTAAQSTVEEMAHQVEQASGGAAQQAAAAAEQAAQQAAAATQQAVKARPRLRFKKRMKRSTKVALAAGGAALVGLGIAAKVLL